MNFLEYASISNICKKILASNENINQDINNDGARYFAEELDAFAQTLVNKGITFKINKYGVRLVANVSQSTLTNNMFMVGVEGVDDCVAVREFYVPKFNLDSVDFLGIPNELITSYYKEDDNGEGDTTPEGTETKPDTFRGKLDELIASKSKTADKPFGTTDTYILDPNAGRPSTIAGLEVLISISNTGEVFISDKSIFYKEIGNEIITASKPNEIFIKQTSIMTIPRKKYYQIWGALVDGLSPDDAVTKYASKIGGDDFIEVLVDEADETKPMRTLYIVDETSNRVGLANFPDSDETLVVISPFSTGNESNSRGSAIGANEIYDIQIDRYDEEVGDEGLILVGENIITKNSYMDYLYKESAAVASSPNAMKTGLGKIQSLAETGGKKINDAVNAVAPGESVEEKVGNLAKNAVKAPGEALKAINDLKGKLKSTVVAARKSKTDEEREDVLNDEFLPAFDNALQYALTAVTAGGAIAVGVNPLLTAITGAIVLIVKDIKDKERRNKALDSLRSEVGMIEEKINDARAAGDNKAKYALMRMRDDLNHRLDNLKV